MANKNQILFKEHFTINYDFGHKLMDAKLVHRLDFENFNFDYYHNLYYF